jgi:hypothetical protein
MEVFDGKLRQLQEDMARKRRLQKQMADLESRKKQLEVREAQLREIREREQGEVEQLEGRSLSKFFLLITGKLEDQLTQERREAAEAAVRHDALVRELEDVKASISDIRRELNGKLYSVEMVYERTLREKKEAMLASGDPLAQRLIELEEQIGNLGIQKKELQEAIDAGKYALRIAASIQSSLSSAENWGTWDMVGGGGMISHMAKHSHLDEAQGKVESLQKALGRFRTELADVKIAANLTVNIEGFARFADYFFDGLFVDWAVQDRIRNASGQVYEVRRKVELALEKLENMKAETERKQAALQKEQEALLSPPPM